jgi:excisionase family DNA binding protein
MSKTDPKTDQSLVGPSRAVERRAFTIQEAARILSISRSTLYELLHWGALPAKKCGARTLILADDLDAFLRNLPSLPAKGPQNGGSD